MAIGAGLVSIAFSLCQAWVRWQIRLSGWLVFLDTFELVEHWPKTICAAGDEDAGLAA